MKPVAIAVLGVLFLLAVGGGAYFYMTQPSQAKDGHDVAELEKHEEAANDVFFIELAPLILSVVDSRGASQVVSLVVSVEVDSQVKADTVNKYAPRLTDAFLSDLYGTFSHKASASNGGIPVTYLKQRLNAVSSKVLGEDVVSDVLLQVLQHRET